MQDLIVPRLKPAAPFTRELRAVLNPAETESIEATLTIPWPAAIVGIHVSVALNGSPTGLIVPTAEDVLVKLTVDQEEQFTVSEGQTTQLAQEQDFITLAALDTRFRDTHIQLTSPKPDIRAKWRWKFFDATIWAPVQCSIGFFVVKS